MKKNRWAGVNPTKEEVTEEIKSLLNGGDGFLLVTDTGSMAFEISSHQIFSHITIIISDLLREGYITKEQLSQYIEILKKEFLTNTPKK